MERNKENKSKALLEKIKQQGVLLVFSMVAVYSHDNNRNFVISDLVLDGA
jgi:hypothetical protein